MGDSNFSRIGDGVAEHNQIGHNNNYQAGTAVGSNGPGHLGLDNVFIGYSQGNTISSRGNLCSGHENTTKKIFDINIREMSGNGFIVKVGCTEFAFRDKQDMIGYLSDYILDPVGTQAKYREGILFKKNNTDIQDKTEHVCNCSTANGSVQDFDDELYKEMVRRMKKEPSQKTEKEQPENLREDLMKKWEKSGLLDGLDGLKKNTDPIQFDSPFMGEKFPEGNVQKDEDDNVQNDGDLNVQTQSHPSVSPNLLLDHDRHDPSRQ